MQRARKKILLLDPPDNPAELGNVTNTFLVVVHPSFYLSARLDGPFSQILW